MDLKSKPFCLTNQQIEWVNNTLANLSLEQKIGQIFCITADTVDNKVLEDIVTKYQPGAFMFRPNKAVDIRKAYQSMQSKSHIPMLLPANLEAGGNGIVEEGTYFSKPLGIAATGNTQHATRLGYVCATEGSSVGCNWSFAPIVDIDMNWRNPITNVRTFGSNVDTVIAMGKAYMQGVKDSQANMAVCIKHFPGDGVDERDQHLLPTLNHLTVEQWFATFGKVYTQLIDCGAETVMVGHFIAPHLVRMFDNNISDSQILPASSNRYIVTDLLRNTLGFNGLVITDATPMVGYSGTSTRQQSLINSLQAGVDMIMFCKNMEEDYDSIRQAVWSGQISQDRLDQAVTRILALKAKLQLHTSHAQGQYVPPQDKLNNIGCSQYKQWSKECADNAVTLVKDNQNLLPLSPDKTKRIRLTVIGESDNGAFGDKGTVTAQMKYHLEQQGFEVSLYNYQTLEDMEIFHSGVADMKKKFDLSLVVANVATGSNYTTRRIDWIPLMAANEPWYTREIPTLFVSFANPYHMIDVPFISTFINCYTANDVTIEMCVQKLVGKSKFCGVSPVDTSCGNIWGAKFM